MLFITALDEITIDWITASSFDSIIKAVTSDNRVKKIETQLDNALQYIKGYYSYNTKGDGSFVHLRGNEMTMLVGYVHMYIANHIDYKKASSGYNNIIQKFRKRVAV